MKQEIKTYTFADTLFNNYDEVITAAVQWHYQHTDPEEIKNLTNGEFDYDSETILDGLIGADYDSLKLPTGKVYNRKELKEWIQNKITEVF